MAQNQSHLLWEETTVFFTIGTPSAAQSKASIVRRGEQTPLRRDEWVSQRRVKDSICLANRLYLYLLGIDTNSAHSAPNSTFLRTKQQLFMLKLQRTNAKHAMPATMRQAMTSGCVVGVYVDIVEGKVAGVDFRFT